MIGDMGQVGGLERLQAIMASNLASELSGTQVVELVMRFGKGGLTIDKAKELMGDDKKMEEFVKNGLKKDPYLAIPAAGAYARYAARAEGRVFLVSIEYIQPSYDMLKNAFDWVYEGYSSAQFKPIDICKNVSTETREIEFELVHLYMGMCTDGILAELDKRELRPALYEELLAFAVKYPDLQKQFPIVALGSVCLYDDRLCSPCVRRNGEERCLDSDWVGNDWHDGYRFLAARE